MNTLRIWDLPTRLFHWALVACFFGLFITGKRGGDAMEWHFRFGYTMASLLLFRLAWGLVGGRWSRFAAFLYPPRALLAQLRGNPAPEHSAGHSPLGAASVLAMLLFLLAQVGTGLFSEDKGEAFGPLSALVSGATVRLATGYHKNIGQLVLLALVLLHLAAIAYYQLRLHRNLVKPMITGDKRLAEPVPASRDDAWSRLAAAALLLASAALVGWVVQLGG
ncbi:cytochrome b/b6 domain-containing protein [Ramlibacter sp. 2FC]|uniref:cytochrome b/b6 domain-containing protein n=1 Tax=Ramlibacter sp. 2FC TaxID=2502188 RepID=UPI0010F6B55B|nr:cytochrome b/b6 domain-containing protein [Ramlibacter sp. 2FC]